METSYGVRAALAALLPCALVPWLVLACGTTVQLGPHHDGDGGGGGGGATCDAPMTACGDGCVDLQSDPKNCGACDAFCIGMSCNGGVCGAACPPPLVACGDLCVDVLTDNANCGGCWNQCAPPNVCSGGSCASTCQQGLANCGGVCVDLQADPQHCGQCGIVCGSRAGCVSGQCLDLCSPGLVYCNGSCVNVLSDPSHCGSCTTICASNETCSAGTCTSICPAPTTLCGGQCVDKQTDENNCGNCGTVCGSGQTCNSGFCQCPGGVCGSCGVTDLGSSSPQTVSGTTVGASDFLSGSCIFGVGPEAVYSFTAPVDGSYHFDTTGSTYDASLYVLGSSCNELACNAGFQTSHVSMNLLANQTVYVVVDAGFTPSGSYVLSITNGPPIACPNEAIGALPATQSGDTTGMPDQLAGSCGGDGSSENTYAFTAPAAGSYTFDTFGSTYNTVLYVLDGNCSGPVLACDDDTNGLQSQVFLPLAANQAVVVVVDGLFGGAGPYVLHAASFNGTCPEADLGSAVPQTVAGSTMGKPNFLEGSCFAAGGSEATYSFTAPVTKSYTFSTLGSSFNTVLYLRSGSCAGPELACNDDFSGVTSQLTIGLTAGQTVVVVVDGFGAGSYQLQIQ